MSGKQRKRSRKTAKDNGTRMETAVESYLQWALDDPRIQRLRLHGSKDVGDIGNVYWHGQPVCIEVKWTQTMDAPQHMREAVTEAGNMDSPYPWVIQKKAGVGLTSMHKLGQQHAYTVTEVMDAMLGLSPSALRARIKPEPLGRKKTMCLITLQEFALILNSGLPLGPDTEDWHDSADIAYGERIMFLRGKIQAFDECAACCQSMLGHSGSMPSEVSNQSEDAK